MIANYRSRHRVKIFFFVLALLTAIQNAIKISGEKKGKDMSKIQSGCGTDCMNCNVAGCKDRKDDLIELDDLEEDTDGNS